MKWTAASRKYQRMAEIDECRKSQDAEYSVRHNGWPDEAETEVEGSLSDESGTLRFR